MCKQHVMQKTAMTKTISGHSTPKSAMAMAIVAIPVTPPLGGLGSFRRQLRPLTRRQKPSRSSSHSHKLSCIQSWLSYLWQHWTLPILQVSVAESARKPSRSSTHSHKLSCIQSWLSYLWQNLRV